MEIVLTGVVGVLCVLCFVTGAIVSQKAGKGEKISFPNPVKVYREHQEEEERRERMRDNEIMLENINNYDGTGLGQRDV